MKKLIRRATILMMLGFVLSSPMVAKAAKENASSQAELAKIFTAHAVKRDSKFTVVYDGPEKDIDDLMVSQSESYFFNSVLSMYDDPNTSDDADYVVGNIDMTYDDFLTVVGNELIFDVKYFETTPQMEYVNEHVSEILKSLGTDSMSNYDKVKAIHDYICKRVTYTATGKPEESSAYGVIHDKKALCNGYSLCLYKLLVNAGIPCKFIGGTVSEGPHAWNIVALGDKWYSVDTTWDDDDDNNTYNHDYFLKGTSDFDSSDPDDKHTMDKPYRTGDFASAFPIAKTAFKKGMDDVNTTVKIGSNDGAIVDPDVPETEYTFKDLIYGKYPSSGKISVKKGGTQYLQLYINDGMEELIDKVTYKVVKGKANIKKIKNYGIGAYKGEYYTDLTFKGKKKGAVQIKIILKLTNGQTLGYTFKGKVK